MRLPLLFLALLLPMAAHADPKDDARRHFMAGLDSAKEEQYEVALQHFLAAQEAFPHPATLYNIARTYTDLDDLPNALSYYRLFRDASPDKAADVDPVIAVIEAKLNQRQAAAAPTGPAPGPAPVSGTAILGPTVEEVARLQAIAAELEALSAVIQDRANQPVAIGPTPQGTGDGTGDPITPPDGEGTGDGTGEGPPTGEGEPPTEVIPELGFIADAYERVVVTASRYGQEPIDSPSTISVLTSEDIRLSGATNLPDLLRRVVGVDVMSQASGHSDVSIRGFNRELSNKVLILIDGRSTYLDFIGSTIWASLPIALEEIERIEVIRGPGSAVYGANAVTGVINIITRTPGEGSNLVKVSMGQPGLAQGTALVSGRKDATSYRFSLGFDQNGRWGKDFDAADHPGQVYFRPGDDDTGLSAFRANGRVDVALGTEGFASVSAGYSDSFAEFYNIGVLGDYGIAVQHVYGRGDVSYGPVHLRGFWNKITGDVGPWSEPIDAAQTLQSGIDSDTIDLELESSGEIETGPVLHRINGGIGYRFKGVDDFAYLGQPKGAPDDRITENHFNAFLSEEATLGKLKVVGQIRADKDPQLPLSETLSPRGSAIYRVADDTSVRVTGGTAFRAPNMVERYMNFDLPSGVPGAFIRDFGDLSLSPERIRTLEVGLHDESTLYHTADVAVYVNQLTDIIGLEPVQPVLAPQDDVGGFVAGTSGWTNLPEVFTGVGVEAEAEFFPADGVDLFVNGNLTNVTEAFRDENGEVASTRDGSSSLVKLNAGGAWRTPYRIDVQGQVSFLTSQTWRLREFDDTGNIAIRESTIPARALISARVAGRPFADEKLELAATLWNAAALSDGGRFREHPNGQLLGSRLFGTVTYHF